MTPTTCDHAGLDQRPDLLHSLAYQIDKSNIMDLLLNTSIKTRKEDYIDIMGRSVSLGSAPEVWSNMIGCSTDSCPHLTRRVRHISFQDRSRTIRLTYILHHPLTTRSRSATKLASVLELARDGTTTARGWKTLFFMERSVAFMRVMIQPSLHNPNPSST